MDGANLARWTRFAGKGGIGRCVAVQDCVAESAEDLMFLKGDEITVLVQLSDEGRFLGYCEGVVGQFSAADVQFTTKLKKAVFAKRPGSTSASPVPQRASFVADNIDTAALPLPPASTIVNPESPSVYSPPRTATTTPPMARTGGRASPATVLSPPPRSAILTPDAALNGVRHSTASESPPVNVQLRSAPPRTASASGRDASLSGSPVALDTSTSSILTPPRAAAMQAGTSSERASPSSLFSPPPRSVNLPPSSNGRASPATGHILSPPLRVANLPPVSSVKSQLGNSVPGSGRQSPASMRILSPPPSAQRTAFTAPLQAHKADESFTDDDDADDTLVSFPAPPTTIPSVDHSRSASTSSVLRSGYYTPTSPPEMSPPLKHAQAAYVVQTQPEPAQPPPPPGFAPPRALSHSHAHSRSRSTASGSGRSSAGSVYSQGSPAMHNRNPSRHSPSRQSHSRQDSLPLARSQQASPAAPPHHTHARQDSLAPSVQSAYSNYSRQQSPARRSVQSAYSNVHARKDSLAPSERSMQSSAYSRASSREREARELELDIASALANLGAGPRRSTEPETAVPPDTALPKGFVSSRASEALSQAPPPRHIASRGSVSTLASRDVDDGTDSEEDGDPFALDRRVSSRRRQQPSDEIIPPGTGATFGSGHHRQEQDPEYLGEFASQQANLGRSDTIMSSRSGEWGIGVSLLRESNSDSSDEDEANGWTTLGTTPLAPPFSAPQPPSTSTVDVSQTQLENQPSVPATPPRRPQSRSSAQSNSRRSTQSQAQSQAQSRKSQSEDGDDDDDDGEEWDGDSIYDGYRYSRMSMYSRRGAASSTNLAVAATSPEMPQRTRVAMDTVSSSSTHALSSSTSTNALSDPAQMLSPGTTLNGWTPSPVLPLSPSRKSSFTTQEQQPVQQSPPRLRNRASSALSIGVPDSAPSGLDMLARVAAVEDDEPLLSHGTFAGSPPMSATSAAFPFPQSPQLTSATALRARIEAEHRAANATAGDDSSESVYDETDPAGVSRSSGIGMRVVVEDGPAQGSPADPILPRGLRSSRSQPITPDLSTEPPTKSPPRAPLQSSFDEEQISRRLPFVEQRDGPLVEDEAAEITPRAPVTASFSQEQLTMPPHPHQAMDSPSPVSSTPRPIGMALAHATGRSASPAPAKFLPHPNAPLARAPRLLPGAGIGSGVFNPFSPNYGEADGGPTQWQETLALVAGRRGMTIKGRTEIDLASASGPVPVRWNVAQEGDAELEENSPIPVTPARGSPHGPKSPHPLSNSFAPGVQHFPSRSMSPSPATAGVAWRTATPPGSPLRPSTDVARTPPGQFSSPGATLRPNPRVGGPRPRSRSFSGFPAVIKPGDSSGEDSALALHPRPGQQDMAMARRFPHRVPSVPALVPSPLSIPDSNSSPTSPHSRMVPSPLSPRRFANEQAQSPLRAADSSVPASPLSVTAPRRVAGLRHPSSTMNLNGVAPPQSPTALRSRHGSGLATGPSSPGAAGSPGTDDANDSSDGGANQTSPDGLGRPSRSLSLRSKISVSAMRAKAADAQRSDVEETVNVQDMEFELVRPVVPAARLEAEGRPSGESHESIRSGRDSARSDSPEVSSIAHDVGTRTLSSAPPPPTPAPGSLDAYRAREQKWMALIGTTQRKNKKVRKLVLEGVPASVRSKVWAFLAGAESRRTPGVFSQLNSKGHQQLTDQIESDVQRFFIDQPHLAEPKGRGPVVNILQAYFVMVADVRYQYDLAIIAGNLALQCPEEDAFWTLVQLMESHLRGYFSVIPVQLDVDAALFAKALDIADSALSLHLFAKLGIEPSSLCRAWFLPLFAGSLPSETLHRVWDVFLFEGPPFLFRVGLALLSLVRRQIMAMQNEPAANIVAFLSRPPEQAFPADPEIFVQLCFNMKLKEEDLKKARTKNAEILLKERMQNRFNQRTVLRR